MQIVNKKIEELKNFGFLDPIEIGPDNVIISGHCRLAGAIRAGLTEVPTITHHNLSKKLRKGYILAANRIAQNAEFEYLLQEDFDLSLTGFTHIVLLATFKQLAELYNLKDYKFRFDFVFDAKIPKSFMNHRQPYYTHQSGAYFTKGDIETIFDCKNAIGIRSENAYWCTIIDAPRNTQSEHGHSKNVKGVVDMLSGFKSRGYVLDLFAGEGTTLIACEKLGRKCVMIELDEKYCDVIIKRWEKFTGKKATLESTGEEFHGNAEEIKS